MGRISEETGYSITDSLYLTTIEVLPHECSFELPEDIPHQLDLIFEERGPKPVEGARPELVEGTIHLRGYALPDAQIAPGDVIPLTLYWQADGLTDHSYTLTERRRQAVGPPGKSSWRKSRSPWLPTLHRAFITSPSASTMHPTATGWLLWIVLGKRSPGIRLF